MSPEWINLFIFGSYLVSNSTAIRCYTCGENGENSVSQGIQCSQFQFENPQFIRECDTESKSCRLSRKVNENVILSRSCEKLKLNDCKVANSVEFCYCTKDLCNKINPLDDEEDEKEENEFDLLEGSGTKAVHFESSTETKKSNHDTPVSTDKTSQKTNVNLHESAEENVISSGYPISHCIWCSVSSLLIYLFIYQQY